MLTSTVTLFLFKAIGSTSMVLAAAIDTSTLYENPNVTYGALETREEHAPICCPLQDFQPAYVAHIVKIKEKLKAYGDQCAVGPKVGSQPGFSRVGCISGSSIYVFNDSNERKIPSCADVARYVDDILNCQGEQGVCGQKFEPNNAWSVVVRVDDRTVDPMSCMS